MTTTLPRWTAKLSIDGDELSVEGDPTSDTLKALVQAALRQCNGLMVFDDAATLVVYKRLAGREPVRDRSYHIHHTGRGIVALPAGA